MKCRGCGHPVAHHRTGERNEHQSRCAYRENGSDTECPCQLHRKAATAIPADADWSPYPW